MREELLEKCERFIRNIEVTKASFGWSSGLMNMCSAASLTFDGLEFDIIRLKSIIQLSKRMTSSFSMSSSVFKPVLCSSLYVSADAQTFISDVRNIHSMLNIAFCGTQYLSYAAVIIAQAGDPHYYKFLADRTKAIYERMRAKHFLITNYNDIIYCAMLALSPHSDDELIYDMNQCSKYVRRISSSSNVTQAVCSVLALCEEIPEFKTERMVSLYNELKKINHKYSSQYELAALAAMSSSQRPAEEIAIDIADADDWLKDQQFFNFLSLIPTRQRRMFAGMLSFDTNISNAALKPTRTQPSFFIKQACICSLMSSLSSGTSC